MSTIGESTVAGSPGREFGPNHRWVVLAIGVAAQASFSATFSGLPVAGILLRTAYGLSNAQLGFILGCMALGVTVSELVWGLLTDKLGDRFVLLLGLLSMGGMLVAMSVFVSPGTAHTPGVVALGTSLVLVGALGGSVNSSSGRAVMTWFTDGKRGFAMSIRQTAIPVGGAIGAALLPFLAAKEGFAVAYLVLASFCGASALATWVWLREAQVPRHAAARTMALASSPLKRLDVWRLALASGLLTVPQIAVLTFAGVFLHDERGAGIGLISVTLMLAQVGGAVLRVWLGRYTDKHKNRRPVIKTIGAISALVMFAVAGAILLGNAAPTPLLAALLCVGGVVANAWHGVAYTEIAVMAGTSRAGTALGMEGTTIFASAFVTPLLIPVLLADAPWTVVWLAIGLCSLVAVQLSPGRDRHPKPGW